MSHSVSFSNARRPARRWLACKWIRNSCQSSAEGVDAEVETRCMRTGLRNAQTRVILSNNLVNLLKRCESLRKRGALVTVSEAQAVFGRVRCCRSRNATLAQLSAG